MFDDAGSQTGSVEVGVLAEHNANVFPERSGGWVVDAGVCPCRPREQGN